MVFFLLGLFRFLARDKELSSHLDLLGTKAFATAILAQVDLGQTGGFQHNNKLGFVGAVFGQQVVFQTLHFFQNWAACTSWTKIFH